MSYILTGGLIFLILVIVVTAVVDLVFYFGYSLDYCKSNSSITRTVGILKYIQLYIMFAIVAYIIIWGGYRAFRK